MDKDPIVKN